MRSALAFAVCGLMAVVGSAEMSAAGDGVRRPPRAARSSTMRMTATAYCDRGKTRSGVAAHEGIVAADPRRLPIGTRLRIISPPGFAGVYSVMDTGSAIKGRDLDIFMASCGRAKRFGKRVVHVRLLSRPVRER